VSDLKPDRQRRDLHKSNLPVTSRKIRPVLISNPLWFLKLKSKLLNFGQNSSLEEISRNTLNRFSVCEIKTFIEGFLFFHNLFQIDFLETFGPFKGESFRNQFRFIHFSKWAFWKKMF
jgi:hypothetical protein